MTELEAQGRSPRATGQPLGGWRRNHASLPHWFKLVIATAVLFIVGGIAAPSSVRADALLSMLPFMAILALASIGQHVVIQQRGFDLSVAGAISLAAVIVTVLPSPDASLAETAGCVLLALLVGIAGGILNGVIVALLRVPPLVATIGVNAILIAFTLVISQGSPHTAPPLLSGLAQGRPLVVPNTALIVLVFAVLVGLAMERTQVGRRFVALGISPRAAAASGVPVNLYRIMTFVFAGLCFAGSGVLMAGFLQVPSVMSGDRYMLPTVAAVVVGGNAALDRRASITATVIGAVLLTYLSQLVISLGFEQSMQYVVQAIIVIASVSLPDAAKWLKLSRSSGPAAAPAAFSDSGATGDRAAAEHPRDVVPALELRGIRKSFGPVVALKNVTLRIYPGEVHSIVGENGAGKSTLLGIAAGTLRANAGEIYCEGKLIASPTIEVMRQHRIAVAYQHPALAPDLTVLENIKLFGAQCDRARAAELIENVALKHLQSAVNRRVADLSLAQRHVVEIARALVISPRVIFLDEPTEPFQKEDVEKLFQLVSELRSSGIAVVYVSHRLHEVMAIADRVSILRDGELIDTRPRNDITNSQIVTLVAGKPLAQVFPAKGHADGRVVLEARGLSGPGFSNVNLTVRSGEIVGLTGVEGQGQREFVRALAGLNRPEHGEVLVSGAAVRGGPGAARKAGIGFIPDDRHAEGVFTSLSVRENIGFAAFPKFSTYGLINSSREAEMTRRAASEFEVKAESPETLVANLSGGNQQKVLFGREVLASPSVLLVDEPTKGIDIGTRSEIYRRLRQISDGGAAVVVSSADGVEIEGLCDRVIIFARGAAVKELFGAEVHDTAITEANMTVTTLRETTRTTGKSGRGLQDFLSGDYFPAIVLGILTVVLAVTINVINPYFLSAFNVGNMLTMTSMLAFVAAAQLCAILAGGMDLSVGPLAGLAVVLASFLMPYDASNTQLLVGAVLIVLACTLYGLLQAALIILLKMPSVVVTLASFIGLQGVSLLLRPRPDGMIDTVVGDLSSVPIAGIPAGAIVTVLAIIGLELLLKRSGVGRRLRAIGSAETSARKLGVSYPRVILTAFGASGFLTGIGALMLAAQIGIGSPVTGIDFTLMSVTAVVLGGSSIAGGRGSFVATLAGAVMVQLMMGASTFLQAGPAWQYGLVGITTVVAASLFSVVRSRAAA
jgi:ribose transport system ATP-binding protein